MNSTHEKKFLKMSIIENFQGLEFKEKFLKCSMHYAVLSRSVMSNSWRPHVLQPPRLLCPWGFSRQEYRSELPCPPHSGDLPNPGIEPRSPTSQADSLLAEPPGKGGKILCSQINEHSEKKRFLTQTFLCFNYFHNNAPLQALPQFSSLQKQVFFTYAFKEIGNQKLAICVLTISPSDSETH